LYIVNRKEEIRRQQCPFLIVSAKIDRLGALSALNNKALFVLCINYDARDYLGSHKQ